MLVRQATLQVVWQSTIGTRFRRQNMEIVGNFYITWNSQPDLKRWMRSVRSRIWKARKECLIESGRKSPAPNRSLSIRAFSKNWSNRRFEIFRNPILSEMMHIISEIHVKHIKSVIWLFYGSFFFWVTPDFWLYLDLKLSLWVSCLLLTSGLRSSRIFVYQ